MSQPGLLVASKRNWVCMIKCKTTNIGKMAILVFWSSARTTGPNHITELPSNTRWRNYPANTISAGWFWSCCSAETGNWDVAASSATDIKRKKKKEIVWWKHYLSQMIKANVNSDKSCWQYVSFSWYDGNSTFSVICLPQTHNLNLLMGRTSGKFS